MKIALVIERMDVGRGGRETSTAQIASQLARRGLQVAVLCQQGSMDDASVSVRELGSRGLTRSARLLNFVRNVQAAIGNEKFDIVHTTLPLPGANLYQPRGGTVPAQEQASLRRRPAALAPLVRIGHQFNSHRRAMGRLERELAEDGRSLWLAVSEMVAGEFERHYHLPAARVRVVYNAVDVPPNADAARAEWRREVRGELGIGPDELVFLVVAKNYALKGVAETLEAFAKWRNRPSSPGGRLVIVGQGPQSAGRYQRQANLRDVEKRVSFVPGRREIFRWYCAADVNILLSWYDPCSRVVLEATRWGVPSITTTYNGAAEVLAQGCGLVVESPLDIQGAVAAMEKLADPSLRAQMSQKCLSASPRLSIERHVDELIRCYREAFR